MIVILVLWGRMPQKFKLIFMDGTEEPIEAVGLMVAWIKGKIRAAEKRTYLLKVEEV